MIFVLFEFKLLIITNYEFRNIASSKDRWYSWPRRGQVQAFKDGVVIWILGDSGLIIMLFRLQRGLPESLFTLNSVSSFINSFLNSKETLVFNTQTLQNCIFETKTTKIAKLCF